MAANANANGNLAGPTDFSLHNKEYDERPLEDMSAAERFKLDISTDLIFNPDTWPAFKTNFLTYVDIHFDELGAIYMDIEKFPVQLRTESLTDASDRKEYFILRKKLAVQILKKVILRFHIQEKDNSALDSEKFVSSIKLLDNPVLMFQALDNLTAQSGSADKISNVLTVATANNRDGQHGDSATWYRTFKSFVHRVRDVPIEFFFASIYLNSIDPKYSETITKFMAKNDFSIDDVFTDVHNFDVQHNLVNKAKEAGQGKAKALVATSTDTTANPRKRGTGNGTGFGSAPTPHAGRGRGGGQANKTPRYEDADDSRDRRGSSAQQPRSFFYGPLRFKLKIYLDKSRLHLIKMGHKVLY